MTNFTKVREFMKICEQEIKNNPSHPEYPIRQLRLKLILEEYQELEDAINQCDIIAIADALTDLLYVVYGAGHSYGIDLDKCFEEVHRSNMTKTVDGKIKKRKDGKILKPDTYEEPNLEEILFPPIISFTTDEDDYTIGLATESEFEDVRNSGIIEFDINSVEESSQGNVTIEEISNTNIVDINSYRAIKELDEFMDEIWLEIPLDNEEN